MWDPEVMKEKRNGCVSVHDQESNAPKALVVSEIPFDCFDYSVDYSCELIAICTCFQTRLRTGSTFGLPDSIPTPKASTRPLPITCV